MKKIKKALVSLWPIVRKSTWSRTCTELKTYAHAFETTAADRDRLVGELQTYRHAFETTAADRDRVSADLASLREEVQALRDLINKQGGTSDFKIDEALVADGRPNVFCAGAPKCGTSFIYSILREHPSIFLSQKDQDTLVDEFNTLQIHATSLQRLRGDSSELGSRFQQGGSAKSKALLKNWQRRYLAHYLTGWKGEAVRCDFFVNYCIDPRSVDLIAEVCRGIPKVIFCVRDPVQRALSEYRARVRQYDVLAKGFLETLPFHEALRAQVWRDEVNPFLSAQYYAYAQKGRYSSLLKPYLERFGRERVHVMVFELDVQEHLSRGLRSLFEFLEIADSHAESLIAGEHTRFYDASRAPSTIEARLVLSNGDVLSAPFPVADVEPDLLERLEVLSDSPSQLSLSIEFPSVELVRETERMIGLHAYRPTLVEEREIFNAYFADEVAELEDILGRRLYCWYARFREGDGTERSP